MDQFQASQLGHEEVAKLLQTSLAEGLTAFEARERLKKFGPNKLEEAGGPSASIIGDYVYKGLLDFLKQFANPLIQLLLLCIVISIIIGEYQSAISVALSVFIVCLISYLQERRADRSLERLTRHLPSICKVVRENVTHEVESSSLVPGDIVILTEGQRVPADLRLFDVHSLNLNESNLTGETHSQPKFNGKVGEQGKGAVVEADDDDNNNNSNSDSNSNYNGNLKSQFSYQIGETILSKGQLGDKNLVAENLALMGTMVEAGHSKGIVISTGKSTRYGEVFSLLKSIPHPKSPLQVNIDLLSMHLVIVACAIIATLSIIGIVQQRPALEVTYYALSLAVTAIPEGLPVVVGVIMALGVLRLSKQKVMVKSLGSLETLGCFQVLCLDKTGTLTRNDMTLTDIVTSELHSLSSSELEELNNDECRKHMTFNKFGSKMYSIGRLMEVGTLCNNASYDPNHTDTSYTSSSRYIGQATECAILDAALRLGFGDSRTKFDRLSERPFSAKSRRMAVLCQRTDLLSNSPMYYVKGAWEEILEDCTHYYESGLVKPRTNEMWLEYARICSALGSQGLRVLALATGQTVEQLTFVGVVGIANAPREGITETIGRLRNEFHVDVKMITGDSRATALAVGKALGLIEDCAKRESGNEEIGIMSGEELQTLLKTPDIDETAKAQFISSKSVFYRVDPVQKANVVSKLQELDKIVAMTGDGVNDIVSLKRANLSLAMGSGADVCKEMADVILVEDDLQTLVAALIEGKSIYAKVRNFMAYQISINLALIVLTAAAYMTRLDAPYNVIQLLFINLLADGPPAQSLGMEKVQVADLELGPRNAHQSIVSGALLVSLGPLAIALVLLNGGLYYSAIDDGNLDGHDRAMLFTCFVFTSVFSALSLRSRVKTIFEVSLGSNKELLVCSLAVLAIQVALVQIEPIGSLFEVEPMETLEYVYLFLYSSLILVFMDTLKLVARVCGRVTFNNKK